VSQSKAFFISFAPSCLFFYVTVRSKLFEKRGTVVKTQQTDALPSEIHHAGHREK